MVALLIVLRLLLYGAKPTKTLGWLLTIFTIPVGGVLLYILLGRNRRKNKLLKLEIPFLQASKATLVNPKFLDNGYNEKLVTLIQKNCNFPLTDNNRVDPLKNGRITFESIFRALSEAKVQIHLQYYIFEEGELANRLLALFEEKIADGVKVRMIYDGVGSFSLSKKYVNKLISVGVEIYQFLPFKFGRFLRSINYRNHRKIIVVDSIVAFTGGINISDKYLKGDPNLGKWHDMHLRIEGKAAEHLDFVFASDWYLVSQKKLKSIIKPKTTIDKRGDKLVQIASGGPDDDFPILEQVYFTIINSAERYLYITNPYIIPSRAILQALETASLSGVDVRLLISENIDNKIVGWCVRSYFETLLKSGIKIYLFPDGFLHSKLIVSDDAIATIGTANLDERSFEQNYEVNALIYDSSIAKSLQKDFLKDSNISTLLSYSEHINRPWVDKLKEGIGKIFSPVL